MSGQRSASLDELDIIALFRDTFDAASGVHGIGDDAALIPERQPGERSVIAMDTMVEGVHFDLRWSSYADVGFKLISSNISDIFAMGCTPRELLLSVALANFDAAAVAQLALGMREARDQLAPSMVLLGGDTVRSPGAMVLSATVVGGGSHIITRAGAQPGDRLWLDGSVGLANAGLRWFMATPDDRIGEPLACTAAHRRPRCRPLSPGHLAQVHACIDISDGLAIDAWRLAEASGVSLLLNDILPGASHLAIAGVGGIEDQLFGGDDYAKLIASPQQPGPHTVCVGMVTAGPPSLHLAGPDGNRDPIPKRGYMHRTGSL